MSDDPIRAAARLLRKAGWTVESPEADVSPAAEIKIKVGRVQPEGLTPAEIHASFRACGFTGEAINYPLSVRAYAWLCAFNGAREGETPWTWRYAPNPAMQKYLDRLAETRPILT